MLRVRVDLEEGLKETGLSIKNHNSSYCGRRGTKQQQRRHQLRKTMEKENPQLEAAATTKLQQPALQHQRKQQPQHTLASTSNFRPAVLWYTRHSMSTPSDDSDSSVSLCASMNCNT